MTENVTFFPVYKGVCKSVKIDTALERNARLWTLKKGQQQKGPDWTVKVLLRRNERFYKKYANRVGETPSTVFTPPNNNYL